MDDYSGHILNIEILKEPQKLVLGNLWVNFQKKNEFNPVHYHSGVFSFILFSGIIRKYNRLIAVSLIVIFLYGSMIWYILPVKEEISWEGHLSGFIVGILFSFIYRNYGPQPIKYHWEEEEYEDEFEIDDYKAREEDLSEK